MEYLDCFPRLVIMSLITRLLFGAPRGDIEALRPALYRIAYAWCHDAALADDLVQETLARALARRGQLRDTRGLRGWVTKILHHCWIDHVRRRREFEDWESLEDSHEAGAETPEQCCDRTRIVACVRAAVARLPMAQREVLTLVDLEEFGYAEVAGILGIPVGTVMSRLSRGRAALKQLLLDGARRTAAPPVLRRVK